MPAALERCVESVMKKWADNPESQPANVKGKDHKEKKSHAYAICNAHLQQNWTDDQDIIELQLSGHGPVLAGVGLTNRPFLKGLPVASVVEEDGEPRIRVPFFRLGRFRHPKGPDGKLIFTPEFLAKMQDNFRENVYGQKVLLDKAHKPDDGNMGDLERIAFEGDIGVGYFIPTKAGLDAVRSKEYLYGSMDFYMNWEGNEIGMSCSDEGFSQILLENQAEEDHYQLFNPYHSKKDGKFTSGSGGATKSGDATPAKNTKAQAVGKIAKKGAGMAAIFAGTAGGAIVGGQLGFLVSEKLGAGSSALVGIFGASLGARAGAEFGSEVADKIWKLSCEEDSIVLSEGPGKFIRALRAFVEDDEIVYLAFSADKNPGLKDSGMKFDKERNAYYIDKDQARKILKFVEDRRSGQKKEEAKQMGAELDGDKAQVVLTQEEYDRLMANSAKLTDVEAQAQLALTELRQQKADLYRRDVQSFIREASLPVNGKGFSKPVLEVVEALLLNSPTGEDGNIQLSDDDRGSVEKVVKYFHGGVRYLLSLIPRDVPVEARVQGLDIRPENETQLKLQAEQEDEELAAFALGIDLTKVKKEE